MLHGKKSQGSQKAKRKLLRTFQKMTTKKTLPGGVSGWCVCLLAPQQVPRTHVSQKLTDSTYDLEIHPAITTGIGIGDTTSVVWRRYRDCSSPLAAICLVFCPVLFLLSSRLSISLILSTVDRDVWKHRINKWIGSRYSHMFGDRRWLGIPLKLRGSSHPCTTTGRWAFGWIDTTKR